MSSLLFPTWNHAHFRAALSLSPAGKTTEPRSPPKRLAPIRHAPASASTALVLIAPEMDGSDVTEHV